MSYADHELARMTAKTAAERMAAYNLRSEFIAWVAA